MDDRGVDAFRELLQEGSKGAGPKTEALEALSLRPVWLATWEPRAEGFRTLINADGETVADGDSDAGGAPREDAPEAPGSVSEPPPADS